MTMTTIDIESLLRWTKPKECNTKRGPRILRTAIPDEKFWDVWESHQQELRSAGLSMSKDEYNGGAWRVCWWAELPKEVTAERTERVELSKATEALIEVPKPDNGMDFYPFQKAGIRYCLRVFEKPDAGVLIGDEPGLGKTLQAIGIINSCQDISRVLIIAPMTLKANWERELKRWLVRPMTIGHATSDFFPRTDIAIIHYNILHKFTTRLSNYWDLMICDECHRLGNRKTRQTKCVVGYKPSRKEADGGMLPTSGIPSRRKLMLSGTPFENHPSELWPIINYIAPGLFSSKSAFEKRYCGACNNGYGWTADGATNLEELGEKLRGGGAMVRRLKCDVLTDLPPKTRQIVEMDGDGLESAIANESRVWTEHEEELEDAQVQIELAKANDSDEDFKTSVANLRQKTGLIFTEMARVRHETAMAKLPRMIEMLKDELEETNKVIVFAHHSDVIAGASKEFVGECVTITGETPQADRDTLVQRFQNDPKIKIFFGSIRATGEGITLTAASTVIFFENDWTASKMSQCSDRSHRIGQKDNVLVKYYILPGTIDARMIQTWIHKEEILEKALDTDRPQIAEEATLIPKHHALASRREIEVESIAITKDMRHAIHEALRRLSLVCDGAFARDGNGFNGCDSRIGKSLAEQPFLSPKQAVLAQRILRKYGRQLGSETLEQCGIKRKDQNEQKTKEKIDASQLI